ncbi:MAG: cell division protein FtsA [Candidatus Berkelbacteria bacterium]|nr:cell division protein FtsA [Candidatus Berkelbacteria bacterium]
MAKDPLVVGLDIGASKIAVCVGSVTEGVVSLMGVTSVTHGGMKKGMIVDIEETVSALSQALEEAEKMSGFPLAHAYISINGSHVSAQPAKGVVAVARPNGEIQAEDVGRVIDAAKTIALPQNRELIHTFPHHFTVDGQDEIRDPIGMNGIRLEVDSLIISASSAALRNLIKTVEQAGIQIDGLVYAPLATARALTTKKQRDSGVVVIDLGAGTTDFAVYEEGELIHCATLPVGSMHITNDIAIGLRTNLDVAEAIKTKYGTVLPEKIRESETINLSSLDPAEDEKVSRRQICEIIEARVAEIFHLIREQLQAIGKDALLPAGAVFTGGGSDIEGLTELARKELRLPATVGFPTAQFSGMLDKLDNPIYACAVGLVLWGVEENQSGHGNIRYDFGKMGGIFDRFRGILRNFSN